jgi:hypothetical protein
LTMSDTRMAGTNDFPCHGTMNCFEQVTPMLSLMSQSLRVALLSTHIAKRWFARNCLE